ncbi:hypothetical protein FJTKL_04748 [Diaporthe vaccinii]|uniref:Uncharacterized protein n=1 Tax=Diaporthe vaccinii TaxID=105482 RepID=A0ABR4F002_9PEZI
MVFLQFASAQSITTQHETGLGPWLPLLVGATSGVRVPEHIGTILVVHEFAVEGSLAGGHGGGAVERPALQKCIELCLARGRFPGRLVSFFHCSDGRESGVEVEGFHGGIVGSAVVVGATEGGGIKPVNGVCDVLLGFWAAVGAVRLCTTQGAVVGGWDV